MCVSLSVSHQSFFLSVCLPMRMSRRALAGIGRRAASHLYFWEVCCDLSIITQLQLKAPANVLPHWEQAISLILFCKQCVCVCVRGSIGQLAGCGPQRWRWLGGSGGETAGVATIGSQVLSVTSTPPLSSRLGPSLLSPFCQEERWHLLWGEADSSHAHQSHCHSPSRHH